MAQTDTEPEILDGELVEVGPAPSPVVRQPIAPVAVQAAALAGAGLVAGAGVVALAKGVAGRRGRRRAVKRRSRPIKGLDVVATRTFLVDVHLVDRR